MFGGWPDLREVWLSNVKPIGNPLPQGWSSVRDVLGFRVWRVWRGVRGVSWCGDWVFLEWIAHVGLTKRWLWCACGISEIYLSVHQAWHHNDSMVVYGERTPLSSFRTWHSINNVSARKRGRFSAEILYNQIKSPTEIRFQDQHRGYKQPPAHHSYTASLVFTPCSHSSAYHSP